MPASEKPPVPTATWLITGVAGFIGSNLLEKLLLDGQSVRGLDNFFSGSRRNLDEVRTNVGEAAWKRFTFFEGDIRNKESCDEAVRGSAYVLHQAAVGSVPRSVKDPWYSHDVNVNGTVQMMLAAKDAGVSRFVYASSSAVYGDDPDLPKREGKTGRPLSPYALTKVENEQYARLMYDVYGLETIGLRYFNVFGPRQDPNGAYAAVIPRWYLAQLTGERSQIYGDGTNSRDFCFVKNVVEMNILAANTTNEDAVGRVFNVGVTGRTTLKDLHSMIRNSLVRRGIPSRHPEPEHLPPRKGDIAHSQADISAAKSMLGYEAKYDLAAGLEIAADWYKASVSKK